MSVGANDLCIPLVFCASAVVSTALSQVERERTGNLSGLIDGAEIELVGVHASLQPDRYSDSCLLEIANEIRSSESVDIVFLAPCGEMESLAGVEFHPSGSELEYVRVAVDFEFDERRTGGRFRTYWEAAGIRMLEFPIALRLTDYDGEFLSGELDSELPLRWLDGTLPESARADRFAAVFRAKVKSDTEPATP